MRLEDHDPPWTMPIPEFGRLYYSLGRSAAYAAAARGEIPVIRIGGKLLGLPRVAEAQLSAPVGSPQSSKIGPVVHSTAELAATAA
jgi:hypothetical protein